MIDILNFFKDNIEYITIGSIFLFSLLVVFSILNINFDNIPSASSNEKVDKIVTIESMSDSKDKKKDLPGDSFDKSFCKKHEPKPHKLNKLCNNFNKDGCNSTRCCVWVKHDDGEECVAGSLPGPTFHGTEESPLNLHYHHYKGECISGSNDCPDKENSKNSKTSHK